MTAYLSPADYHAIIADYLLTQQQTLIITAEKSD
jgi:hypothetical protein